MRTIEHFSKGQKRSDCSKTQSQQGSYEIKDFYVAHRQLHKSNSTFAFDSLRLRIKNLPRLTLPTRKTKCLSRRGRPLRSLRDACLVNCNYKQKICRVSESNQGHRDFQSLALPTELTRQMPKNI